MAASDYGPDQLIPNLYGNIAFFYAEPNPALTEALAGDRLLGIVSDYTGRVWDSYMTKLASRRHASDEHPGQMASLTRAEVFIGGYKDDRWIGQITVGVEYAMADEFGRHEPAEGQNHSTYEGSGDLRGALYEHLPPI